ncbi:LysR family transcriptional regulator [Hafnia paralvei]|uniref:LysR family transcriptional regulator n=1 Tax=Hafnia paralvei TaxID=546367 RepID=UPI000DF18008|nr:LysR family transcriptional regulator [Hafnia paralvei]NIH30351.1 LysR family transcriptional regulator [Hafnia paralvei]RDA68944.1 LysR family transcriptional regulator [Hafnia paralvei]RDA70083.1 LysR family transcriptional regulator [Hafnia paralvei]RDA70124.1 LysR family transcriptional regulator [Hafnia paralvei]RDA79378.1 LysR family transcriptional regulator [Hafnia paralvei]
MIDSEITLRKLEIFLAFMEKENISRAAESLGLSSVSVHRALHTLEEGFRCPLFVHKGRNLLPLPAAHTLAEYAHDLVELAQKGIEETRIAAGFGQQRMRIGTMYSLTLETIPKLIMGVKLRRPEVEISLTMGSNQDLLQQLEDQQLDAILISISDSQVNAQLFETLPLFKDDIFLAAPATSTLIKPDLADLRDYRGEKFVSLAEGFATYHGFNEAFQIAGFEPYIVTRVNDIFSMLSLVQAGVGYTLIPGRMKNVYENSVKLLPLCDDYQMRQTIALVFARSREQDPNILALTAEGRMYARAHQSSQQAIG